MWTNWNKSQTEKIHFSASAALSSLPSPVTLYAQRAAQTTPPSPSHVSDMNWLNQQVGVS